MLNEKKSSGFEKYFSEHRSYIVGVIVGLILIAINVYVGLYVVDLLLTDKKILVKPGLSLPVIQYQDYEIVKKDLLNRQTKELGSNPKIDPFQTSR